MSGQTSIITLNPENYLEYGCPCFLNPKNEGHVTKLAWLKDRLTEGLTIKHLLLEGEKKPIGFIEYIPGKYAWRAVNAQDYMFIHCIWISPNKYKEKGYGSLLVEECVKDAENQGKTGVAIVASSGPFMAGNELFLKNSFEIVDTKKNDSLLAKKIRVGALPEFKDWQQQLGKYQGLHIVYSKQCPWVVRSIPELEEIAGQNNLDLKITEMETAEQAQNAPSVYSVFNLIYKGRVLADRYISGTRFRNIIKKELKPPG